VGRPLGVKDQPFFVEGVASALDDRGEFFFNRSTQKMFVLPNKTTCTGQLDVAIPSVETVIHVDGAESVRFQQIQFKFTARTILQRYTVPSPGDWAIFLGGAVVFTNVVDCAVRECVFNRTGSNAVFVGERAIRTVRTVHVVPIPRMLHTRAANTLAHLSHNGAQGGLADVCCPLNYRLRPITIWGSFAGD
jgi:hypothetical protein